MKDDGIRDIRETEGYLAEALTREEPLHLSDIIEFQKETTEIRNKLLHLRIRMRCIEREELQNLMYNKEYMKRTEIAELLIELETDMVTEFLAESENIDIDDPDDRRKFYLWKEILLTADKACRKVKSEFVCKAFFARPEARDKVFKSMVQQHVAFLKLLSDYRLYLPEDTKHNVVAQLQESNHAGRVPEKPKEFPPVKVNIDPGSAPSSLLAELYVKLSDMYSVLGGSGLKFVKEERRPFMAEVDDE